MLSSLDQWFGRRRKTKREGVVIVSERRTRLGPESAVEAVPRRGKRVSDSMPGESKKKAYIPRRSNRSDVQSVLPGRSNASGSRGGGVYPEM